MSLEKSDYVVLSKGTARKRRGESWNEMLRRWLVECPRCSEVWLVVGARDNESYICKDCGHGFVIKLPGAGVNGQSNSASAERHHE